MKNKILCAITLAATMSLTAVSHSYAAKATLNSEENSVQLTLDTKLAIADAQVSTVTPVYGSSQVVLEGNLDNYGTFRQTPGTRAEFDFTSSEGNTAHSVWFRNIKQGQTDREWFQDVNIVFEKIEQSNGYYIARVNSDKSFVSVCTNPAQPVCFKFKAFGHSLQPMQSVNDITYYIMAPVAEKSGPSIIFQFKVNPMKKNP